MKILLVGGGSGGPVAPLLAIAQEITNAHPKAEFLLVGTKNGPEQRMAESANIPFKSITSGKWRRYFSLANFTTPFLVIKGFIESFKILKIFKPSCVFGTGSFVQVPLVWAAWFLKIPVVLHQQDIIPSLANRLCQLCANNITVTFEPSLKDFSSNLGIFYKKHSDKVSFTGNPFRSELRNGSKESAAKIFNLKDDMPTLLVLGGGTGARGLNELVVRSLPQLNKIFQVIHSTGTGKISNEQFENYHPYEFISDMASAYAAANIVLCRAGLSTITELSNLKKVSIIVPMPDSHQEANAMFMHSMQAAVVLIESNLNPERLINLLRKLLFANEAQEFLKQGISKVMPHNANQKIAEIILKNAEK